MGHWYSQAGQPHHFVPNKSKPGQTRPTTIADARKHGYFPSVSGIISVLDKPGLNVYKENKLIEAAYTRLWEARPDQPEDSIKRFGKSLKSMARADAIAARDKGIAIHRAIEHWITYGDNCEEYYPYLVGVERILDDLGLQGVRQAETTFCSRLGYGGTVDLTGQNDAGPWIVDFKSKEFDDPSTRLHWDEDCMQIAAYAQGLDISLDLMTGVNIYISRDVPGMVVPYTWEAADLWRGWEMFKHALKLWQLRNNFDPADFLEKAS